MNRNLSLSTARWIVIALYLTGVGVYPIIGSLAKAAKSAPPDALRVMLLAMLGIAGVFYLVSLIIEAAILRKIPTFTANAAVITASLGESIALFGLVLQYLGAGSWSILFYTLCAAHGLHLLVRWPNFQQAAGGVGE